MKIKFRSHAKGLMHTYTGAIGTVRDGQIVEVEEVEARRLIRDFPHNFEAIIAVKSPDDLAKDVLEQIKAEEDEKKAVEDAPHKMVTEESPPKQEKKFGDKRKR